MSRISPPDSTQQSLLGAEAIKRALATIPTTPGVYRMIAADDRILYIGKAKNLHNRVSSYAHLRDLSTKTLRMVSQVVRVEFTVTKSEAEALLVEANFVRKYRPHYNILLKDDKSFPALRITDHEFPRIEKHRGAQTKGGEYFGPFASVGALNETLALLQKIFLLRPCADTVFKNRTRPCLQYQIKRCSAPCVGYVTADAYGEQLARARAFLRGRARDVQDALATEMHAASTAMDYEKAALLRDRIRALTQVQQEQGLRIAGLMDADVMALARRGAQSIVLVSFYRQGSHFGQQSFKPRHEADASDGDVMAAFLAQFYQSHTPPAEILLSTAPSEIDLLTEALTLNTSYGIELRIPQRGDKLRLVQELSAAAETALARAEMESASVAKNLLQVKALFDLPSIPQRIEVYDNSHIMGTNAIGAFIVATPDGFDKRSYRSYTIQNPATIAGDDYGMMREVFTRRFKGAIRVENHESSEETLPAETTEPSLRGAKRRGNPDKAKSRATDVAHWIASPSARNDAPAHPESPSLPDLVLIDGGLGQLHAVQEALRALGVTPPPLVAIAKGADRNAGREWFFMEGREPFQLPVGDPTLHYLQRLRDEAHRFAIGKHRGKRSKAFTTSALDDIAGIGASRKRALLQHFGSRADVENATLAELEKVEGISKKTARTIYDYFHG